ncbi:putative leader peptide [Sphaerisporangium perillae]
MEVVLTTRRPIDLLRTASCLCRGPGQA